MSELNLDVLCWGNDYVLPELLADLLYIGSFYCSVLTVMIILYKNWCQN